ncbi:MAG: WYL domain-containing protein [Clostridiales bacterium]|nr:WYL domain-containing protein [Clostridiales bacterium]
MANSELSKLKILFIYDFFKNQISSSGGRESVSVNELIAYLEEQTGTTFERKSIYADISKINEYVRKSGQTKDDSWIFTEGKKYKRTELGKEILIDEARLIVDAISTTTFVNSDLCEKIINMFPTYFEGDYQKRALYPHNEKMDRKSILLLNNIRNGIETKNALKITYGYLLGSNLTEKTEKIVSPMALDWENNCYYLIAIDNAEAKDLERDHTLTSALRRYRVDRIASIAVLDKQSLFIDYKTDRIKDQELKSFINNSLSAYSSSRTIQLGITISGKTRKDALKAYGAFSSKIKGNDRVRIADDTKLDKGILMISVNTGLAPTLYTDLFELSTFENVDISIDNEEVCREYGKYIKKAASAAKLDCL